MQPKFKKGDKVRVNFSGKDSIFTIEEIVYFDNCMRYGVEEVFPLFNEDHLELVQEEPAPKFKKGDKVKSKMTGDVYEIYMVEKRNNKYYYHVSNNTSDTMIFESGLELVEEPRKIIGYKVPFDMFHGKWKKGDIVKIIYSTDYDYYVRDGNFSKNSVPKEIAKTWEPVYEQPEQLKEQEDFFIVMITETLEKEVVVKAKDEKTAIQKVEKSYADQEYVLDSSDYVNTVIEVVKKENN